MEFRCKRYRIREVTRKVPRRWGVESVFVVQRRCFRWLWLRQPIPHIYFDFPFGWVRGHFVFYQIEDAVDALCAWLRNTHRPDDYMVYITLPTLAQTLPKNLTFLQY